MAAAVWLGLVVVVSLERACLMFGGSSWNVEVFLDVAIPTLVVLYG